MILISAILLGFLGSMHCVGMCGPLVIAIPVKSQSKLQVLMNGLSYNFGRVISYSFIGLIFGLLGESLSIIMLQSQLSIALGSIILLYLILPKSIKSKLKSNGKFTLHVGRMKSKMGALISRTTLSGSTLLGVLNGFLPCGLVYAAVAGAVATGNIFDSVIYMALFGIGTIPAMATLYYFKNQIDLQIRRKINKFIPYGIALVAIIMIFRGLNLGIPMLSPDLNKHTHTEKAEACCEPSEKFK